MAFTPNNYLTENQTGPGGGPELLRDQQHAAKLFTIDQFRLAPKSKFLFHVAFGINPACLKNPAILTSFGQEINMLVKSADLPNFQIQTEVLNQYNRKKVVQYKAIPSEIGITFHDDNMGLINQVWQNYYSYYYADPTTATIPGAYSRNATQAFSTIPASYGYDAGSTVPFFNYIKIYQMARHEYVMYQLWNPIITNWNHNKLSYSDYQPNSFDMKVNYEAVSYSVGAVSADSPEGFGITHYDTTLSPLQANTAAGDTPAINNAAGGASFVTAIDTTGLAAGALSKAISQVNTYQNSQQSSSPLDTVGGTIGAAAGVAGVIGVGAGLLGSAIGGLGGIDLSGGLSSVGGAISDAAGAVGGAISDAAGAVGDAISSAADAVSGALGL